MINANELRVGNRIVCAGVTMIVTGWDIYQLNKYIRENDTLADKYEPIELTPEILKSAGFEPFGDLWSKNNLSVWWYHARRSVMLHKCMPHDVSYRYLHQLQNLYFALTGQELTINLHATV